MLPPYSSSDHPSAITALQGPTSLTISVTPFVNLILAGLIVGRLLYHQRHIRKLLGAQYASPYNKIIAMCIESCSMIIINSVIYIGLYYGADRDGQNFEILTVLLIFPHICVSYFTWVVMWFDIDTVSGYITFSHYIPCGPGKNCDGAQQKYSERRGYCDGHGCMKHMCTIRLKINLKLTDGTKKGVFKMLRQ